MIEQCKGKDFEDVPQSKLLADGWYPNIKFDGNFVQIHKKGDKVEFWTSGGKQFYIEHIAEELIQLNPGIDFKIETEFIADTDGKLGSRNKCSTTSYRVKFSKGLHSGAKPGKLHFKVFLVLAFDSETRYFDWRVIKLRFKETIEFFKLINFGTYLTPLSYETTYRLGDINHQEFINNGWEGLMLIHEDHIVEPGKRVNTIIKRKGRRTADLLCIDIIGGEGKYTGQTGSLVLQDSQGRIVNVGSGLSDTDRRKPYSTFIGKVVQITYEQLQATYLQPVYECIRHDKTEKDIN